MGTDIHFHVEKKTSDGWVRAEPLVENKWFGKFDDETEFVHDNFYTGRNYSLFAMLAGVRNGYGFAGVDRGDPIVPISEPRGLPDDVSDSVAKHLSNEDGHDHSWLSLRELLTVPWHSNKIVLRGVVGPKAFNLFDKHGLSPQSYSGSVSGHNVFNISNDEMRKLIEDGTVNPRAEQKWSEPSYYTQIEWTSTWADEIGDFLAVIARMASIAASEDLGFDDVRAVFSFDS